MSKHVQILHWCAVQKKNGGLEELAPVYPHKHLLVTRIGSDASSIATGL
jgi:hypothetical protein